MKKWNGYVFLTLQPNGIMTCVPPFAMYVWISWKTIVFTMCSKEAITAFTNIPDNYNGLEFLLLEGK